MRRAFDECQNRASNLKMVTTPDHVLAAIDGEVVKTSAIELAWAVLQCVDKKRKSPVPTMKRIAFLYKTLKDQFYPNGNLLHCKLVNILSEAAGILIDAEVELNVVIDLVSVFHRTVMGFNGPVANSILWLLSNIVLPPENTGSKRLDNVIRKGKVHLLMNAAIHTCEINLNDANEALLRSASLKTLFITQFKQCSATGFLCPLFANRIRSFLGVETDDMGGGGFSEAVIDSFLDELLDSHQPTGQSSTIYDPSDATEEPNALPDPHSLSPPRKKIKPNTESPNLVNLVNLSAMASSGSGRLTSHFKIKRGVVTKVVKDVKPVSMYDFLLCKEPPIVDDL